MAVGTRYSITSARRMMTELDDWIEQTNESISNEEDRDYPNDARLEALQTRLEALEIALDALGDLA